MTQRHTRAPYYDRLLGFEREAGLVGLKKETAFRKSPIKQQLRQLRETHAMTATAQASSRVPLHRRIFMDFDRRVGQASGIAHQKGSEYDPTASYSTTFTDPKDHEDYDDGDPTLQSSFRKPRGLLSKYMDAAIIGSVDIYSTAHGV